MRFARLSTVAQWVQGIIAPIINKAEKFVARVTFVISAPGVGSTVIKLYTAGEFGAGLGHSLYL